MKTTIFTLGIALLWTLSLAAQNAGQGSSSQAVDGGGNGKAPTGLGGPDFFKAADTDANGFINKEEFQRHRASHSGTEQSPTGTADVSTVTALSFEALDANGDGKLNQTEFSHAGASEWRSDKTKETKPGATKGDVIEGAR